jgi:acetyl-CoA synthetase
MDRQLVQHLRQNLSPIATPEKVVIAPELPKTRSGKIMRRILRKLAEGDYENLGDISTLANPEVVENLKSRL